MVEEWKRITETNKNYEVSNLGRVRNSNTGRILSPRPTKTGYLRVQLPIENGRKDFYIHRLVATYFCEHPEGKDVVNHKDNNCQNNIVTNLEWVDQRDNVLYAMNQDRVPNFPNAKIVIGQKGNEILKFRSTHEAAKYFDCDHKSIQKCCVGKQALYRGYSWHYEEEAIS